MCLLLQVTDADLCDYLHLCYNSSSATVLQRASMVLHAHNSACVPTSEALALLHTLVERDHVTQLQRKGSRHQLSILDNRPAAAAHPAAHPACAGA
jgi:hypothetical protein